MLEQELRFRSRQIGEIAAGNKMRSWTIFAEEVSRQAIAEQPAHQESIFRRRESESQSQLVIHGGGPERGGHDRHKQPGRSEEHTSELQSRENLVCRLL